MWEVLRQGGDSFVSNWYELTKDIRYFADDGSTPDGYGTARHDQTILSILGYLKGLYVFHQDWAQNTPMILSTEEGEVPFYITWHKASVRDHTCLYSSRDDLSFYDEYVSYIRYKE